MSLSFILIIFISLFVGIRPEIVFGYSIATLIFAVIDFISVLQDGKNKINKIKKDGANDAINDYVSVIDSMVEDAMESIQDGKRELVNTRRKFYGKLVDQQPIFNLKKRNVKKAMKPAENIKEISKDIQISSDFINNLIKDLKSLDPSSEGKGQIV